MGHEPPPRHPHIREEDRFHRLFEQSMDAVYIGTPDGTILDVNQAWLDLFGYSRQELPTLNAIDFYAHPEERAAFLQRMNETGFVRDEVLYKRRDGGIFLCQRSLVACRDSEGRIVEFQGINRDISEIRAAENALRASEQRYRALFEQSIDAIYVTNPDGSSVEANQAWLDLFGYERDDLSTLNAIDIYAEPSDREDFLRRIREDGFVRDELRFKRKDGQVIDCERTVVALTDERGRIRAYQGIHRDITRRRRELEALRTSEERYRSLFQNVMDAVSLVSPGGLLLEANQAYLDLFGYTEEDVGTINVEHQYIDPNDRTRLLEHLAYHDLMVDDEVRLRTLDGTVMDCVRNVIARRDSTGTFIGAQSVIRDVTRQKRVLEELRQSEERFMQLALQSRTVAWEVDADGLYTYVSPVIEEVLGYQPQDLVAQVHIYELHPEAGRDEFASLVRRTIKNGAALTDFENPMLSRDGGVRWFLSSAVPLLDETGHLRGYHGWDMDITGRKRAESAIRETEQRFRSLFEQSRDAIYIGTPDGTVIDVNQAWLDLFGYTREDLPSINAVDFYAHPDERAGFLKRLIDTGAVEDEVRFKRKDGSEFDCDRSVVARTDQHGNVLAVQGILRDVTQQKLDRQELERLARYDTLTGLLNRHSIVDKLSEWIRHSRRYHGRLSVVLLDIDHFKRINDTYGHAAGDQVLQETASLLMSNTRQADFVGRYGGEEFLIILPRTDIEGAAVIAERIRAAYEATPLHLDDSTVVRITISLGVTQWHEDDSAHTLLARVDAALYRAKEGGRNRVEMAQAHSSDT